MPITDAKRRWGASAGILALVLLMGAVTKINLVNQVSGVLPPTNGGTGKVWESNGTTTLTPASGIGTTITSTGLVFPATNANTAQTYRGTCHLNWKQITAVSTVTFLVGNSVAPTAEYSSSITSMGSLFSGSNVTTTTTTAVSNAIVPAAANTIYAYDLYVFGSFPATSNTVTLYAQSGSATNTITIQPGSYCNWFP